MATHRLKREKRSGRSEKSRATGSGYKAAFFVLLFCIAVPYVSGTEGAMFFYMSFFIAAAIILLFPFALSQVCNRMIRVRHGAGGDRAAGAVRKACLSVGIIYPIAAFIITVIFKDLITEKLLPDNGSVGTFYILSAAFLAGALYLILNATVDPYLKKGETADIADAGAILMPAAALSAVLFSLSKSRMTSSLLDNTTSGKAVFSASLSVGVLAAAVFLFLRTFLLYLTHSKRIDKIIAKDRAKLREPGFILSVQTGFRHFMAILPAICLLPALVIIFGICLKIRGVGSLFLYDSGLFLLLVSVAFSFPFLYSITYFGRESYMLSRAYNAGETSEVWNRVNILLKTVFPCGLFFTAWFIASSSSIVPCILNERSMAGSRLLYFIAPIIPLAAISAGLLYILLSIDKSGLAMCSTFVPMALSLIFCYIIGSKTNAGLYVLPISLAIYIILALTVRIVFVFYTVDVRLPYKYFGEVLLCAVISGAAMKILSLLTGLIKLPDLATAVITFIAGSVVYFILLCNARLITVYTVKDQPMGKFLYAAGKRFRIIHKNERE